MDYIKGLALEHGWLHTLLIDTEVFAIVFLTLIFAFGQKRILIRLHRRLERTKSPWDDAFIGAMQRPLGVLIWIIGLAFAAELLDKDAPSALFSAVGPIREVGIIWVLAWFVVRFLKRAEANILVHGEIRGQPVDRTTLDAVMKLLRISVFITAALVALQTLGFSVSGVLAFGGIGGIAVGFAAKDLLANFFGGLMIYLDRPFTVGEWIRSPDRQIEGTVEDIGWRLTRIRTFDKRPLYVPNSVFATIAVENPARMLNRRIHETVGLRYEDVHCAAEIVRDVRSMLLEHREIDQDQTLMVNLNEFSESSVDFFVYAFTKTTNWAEYHGVKEDVLLRISDIVGQHGAEIAFPTRTVHLERAVSRESAN